MSDGWIAGVFSVSVDMSANRAAGIPIVASAFSNQMDVVKAGINNTLTKDGQNVPTSVLPMGGYRHTGVGKAQALTDYQRVNEFIYMSPLYMVDSEAGTATVSLSTAFWPSLSAGMRVVLKNNTAFSKPNNNSGNVVIKINGVSANCSAADGTQLWPGAFTSAGVHELQYDGSNFKLLNPSHKVIPHEVTAKCRTIPGVTVTASGTVSITCEMWRDADTATVQLNGDSRYFLHWQTSVGEIIYLSVLPTWMRPVSTKYFSKFVYASSSTERFATVHASTDGRIVIAIGSPHNFDVDCALFPFSITYPVK